VGLALIAAAIMFAVVQWAPRLFGDVGGLAHTVGRPAASGLGIVAGIAVLALLSTWYLSPLRRSMLAPARGLLLSVALGIPLLVGAWLMLWHTTYEDPFTRSGWRCFVLTLLTAPWPFVVLALPSQPPRTSRFTEF
jgi:hypothetical protein